MKIWVTLLILVFLIKSAEEKDFLDVFLRFTLELGVQFRDPLNT